MESRTSRDRITKLKSMIYDKIQVNDRLSVRNGHPRDKNITFQSEGHKYTIKGEESQTYTSVTTWNSTLFPKVESDDIIDKMFGGRNWRKGHKYWGMSREEIKEQWNTIRESASLHGECLHKLIEYFMNRDSPTDYPSALETCSSKNGPELTHKDLLHSYLLDMSEQNESKIVMDVGLTQDWYSFLRFVTEASSWVPYRTEWRIYHEELKLSGTIDMVYIKDDGSLIIVDWKRTKNMKLREPIERFRTHSNVNALQHIEDTNYWHYCLQLNMYRMILQEKYDKVVSEMYLVRFNSEGDDQSDSNTSTPDSQGCYQDRTVNKPCEIYTVPIMDREVEAIKDHRIKTISSLNPAT